MFERVGEASEIEDCIRETIDEEQLMFSGEKTQRRPMSCAQDTGEKLQKLSILNLNSVKNVRGKVFWTENFTEDQMQEIDKM